MLKFLHIFLFIFIYSISPAQKSDYGTFADNAHKIFQQLKKGGNQHRQRVVYRNLATEFGKDNVKKEAIDWFGIYKNIIYEKKGTTDSIVYITCHFDKVSSNLLYLANVQLNGFPDFIFSALYLNKGIYDNGSGVATALLIAQAIKNIETHYTYRFLFCGQEEFGLRGSRRHVAGLSKDEWSKVSHNINLDMFGAQKDSAVYFASNYASPILVNKMASLLDSTNISLKGYYLEGGLSDFIPFQGFSGPKDILFSFKINMAGSLIPQKSYFSGKKEGVPTISLSDEYQITFEDIHSPFCIFAHGNIHSFKDTEERIYFPSLYNYYQILYSYIEKN